MTGGGGWERQPSRRGRCLLAGMFLAALILGAGASCRKTAPLPAGGTKDDTPSGVDLRLDAGPGFGSNDSAWMFLRVQARNLGSDLHGELEVRGLHEDPTDPDRLVEDPVAYVKTVDLPGGSPVYSEHSFAVRTEGWKEVKISLRTRALETYRQVPLPPEDPGSIGAAQLAVLVITDAPRDLSSLRTHLLKVLTAVQEEGTEKPSLHFVEVSPARLVPNSLAFDAYSLVILYGSGLEEAPPDAVEALRRHVSGGGTLLAIPGPAWGNSLSPELRRLLGVQSFTDDRQILPVEALSWPDGELAVVRSEGLGRVTVLASDPAPGRPFPPPSDAPRVYEALQETFARAFGFVGCARLPLRAFEEVASQLLHRMCEFSPPWAGTVCMGALVYLFLGFAVPRAIFRSPRRRHWVFPWIFVASLAAIGLIAGFGFLRSLEEIELEEVSVVRLSADGARARVTSFLGVISPTPRRLSIASPGEAEASETTPAVAGTAAQPLRTSAFMPGYLRDPAPPLIPPTVLLVDGRGGPSLPSMFLYPNTMRFFRFDYDTTPAESVRVERVGDGPDEESLKLTNTCKDPLEVYLLKEGVTWTVSGLAPGQSAGGDNGQLAFSRAERGGGTPTYWEPRNNPIGIHRDTVRFLLRLLDQCAAVDAGHVHRMFMNANSPSTLVPWGSSFPSFLAAVRKAPFFPEQPGIRVRRAITVFVTEIPRRPAP